MAHWVDIFKWKSKESLRKAEETEHFNSMLNLKVKEEY